MSEASDFLIQVKDVRKAFTVQNETTEVLKGISFNIPRNSFVTINGPSGSGKSTLLNVLVGLDSPTSGSVILVGQSLYDLGPDERAFVRAGTLGMVYQSMYWVKSKSVLENVAMPLYLSGHGKHESEDRAWQSLKKVGMEEYAKYRPTFLSGGQQQRVGLARALVSDPALIVADEPTGNLDTKNGDMVMELLASFRSELGKTVILVTHNPEYIKYSDLQYFMRDGLISKGEA